MGLIISLINFFIKLLLYFAIFVAIIVLIPNLPPHTKFTSIQLEPTQQRIGPLAPNDLLNNAEKLYEGKLVGPEAFQIYNGQLYTSLATGEIVKVSHGGHVTFVTKIGHPCTGLIKEHICGRPLGFEIDEKTNTLYVADAYHGIWKVDLKTEKKQLLVSPQVPIEGRQPKLFNSITLAKNGDLYWTDSTSDFHLKDGAISILTDPSGRLFYYNAAKNQSKVLLDNLWFPNGIVLSHDNQFVVVAETARFRLMKYYIDGPKKGKSEVFAAGLPGNPDNVRVLPDNSGVLVGLYTVFDDDHPHIARAMTETPLVRKFLARLQRLIEIPFEYLNNMYPHFIFEEIVYNIGHIQSVSGFTPDLSGLLQLDWNGNIVASYINTDSSLAHISDAIVYNGKLLTGNPHIQNFIGSVPAPPLLLKAFSVKKVEQQMPKVEQKPEPVRIQATKPKIQEIPKSGEINVVQKVAKPVESQPSSSPPEAKPVENSKPLIPPQNEKRPTTENKPSPSTEKQTQLPPSKQKPTDAVVKPGTKSTHSEPVKSEPTPAEPPTKPTANPEMKPSPKLETKPTPKSETKATPKSETKPTPKPESNPTPKSETKPTPKPETKPTPKPETKPKIKSTPQPESRPTPKSETKVTPTQETNSTPKPETKTTSKPEIKATQKLEVKTTQPPKTAETKPTGAKQQKKPTGAKQEKKPETTKPDKPNSKPIPINEHIPSDTKKPNTDTLKVIKKGGPAEIPNPEL